MMKMNLIAGFLCVALMSACSSQKIAAGDGTTGSTVTTTVAPNNTSAPSNNNSDTKAMLKSANADQPAATMQTSVK